MNEMAKARGFYPVTNKLEYMQAPAWVSRDGGGHKGKSKGCGKKATATRWRKGTGKSNTGAGSSSASAPAAAPPPNTSAHGATSQHGPRFKRTRFGAPHEVKMVEEIHQCSLHPCSNGSAVQKLSVVTIPQSSPFVPSRIRSPSFLASAFAIHPDVS